MISKAQYERYASVGFNYIPLSVELLSDLDTPLSTYLKLCREPYGFLFESLQGGETWGRYSIIGLPCSTRLEVSGNEFRYYSLGQHQRTTQSDNPLDAVRAYQQHPLLQRKRQTSHQHSRIH